MKKILFLSLLLIAGISFAAETVREYVFLTRNPEIACRIYRAGEQQFITVKSLDGLRTYLKPRFCPYQVESVELADDDKGIFVHRPGGVINFEYMEFEAQSNET